MNSNLEIYNAKLERFLSSLDAETLEALEVISVFKSFKKGALLLKPGEVCQWSYQILDGIARKYYLNEGKQITTELYFLGDIAISFGSYALQNPSTEYIEAHTEVKVSAINYIAFQEAKAKHPKLMELDIMLLEYYGLWIEERLLQLRTLSAVCRQTKVDLLLDSVFDFTKLNYYFIFQVIGVNFCKKYLFFLLLKVICLIRSLSLSIASPLP